MTDITIARPSAEERENGFWLVCAALAASLAIHAICMYAFSGYSFDPLDGTPAADRKWTRDVPQMHVSRLAGDPLAAEMNAEGRPVAAPVEEKTEERVERLADIPESSPAAVAPAAAAMPAPEADAPAPAPARPDVAAENAKIEIPSIPDDGSTRPQRLVPERNAVIVSGTPSVQPPDDLLSAAIGTMPASAPDSGFGIEAAPPPSAVPAPPGVFAASSGKTGFGTFADEVKALDESVRRGDPPPEAAPSAQNAAGAAGKDGKIRDAVDESLVRAEKEAVRTLRDTAAGERFEKNVVADLAHWTDSAKPDMRYFRVRISVNSENPLPVVDKDVLFVIDASGSIGKDRLPACCKAIGESLRRLNSNDRFNIVAFRDKFKYAFPAWQEVDAYSVQQADRFLGRLFARGYTDVFATLRSIMAVPRDPTRPMTALVVTDGEATSGMTRSAEIISAFSELNGGLVSIYMYGVKDKSNAYLMDMLARGNRGGWMRHEGMRWRVADGIPVITEKFADPVLADVAVTFSAASRAEAYPKLVTNLCKNEPIEIWGVCPASNREIVFSLRGIGGKKVYESVFRIPFDAAKMLGPEARTEWSQRRLYSMVEAYSKRPSAGLLADIRAFARMNGLSIPYEEELK